MRHEDPQAQCRNLYRFIRLVLGPEPSDREIARRWGIDEKNLRELKRGVRVVPKLGRLEELARALGIHRYYVLEVAAGVPAEKVHEALRRRELDAELQSVEQALAGRASNARAEQLRQQGLQAAAFAAYRTLEPQAVLPRVSRELKQFGFESHLFMLTPDHRTACIEHSSFHPRLLRTAERVTGLTLSGFRFPLERVPAFPRLLRQKSSVFLPDATILLRQILGENRLRSFVDRMREIFRILEVVLVPIQVRGQVRGVLATGQGGQLNESCLTEMDYFSEQLSHSLENAFLFDGMRRSEAELKQLFSDLPEGVFACDGDGRIARINPAGAQLLGYREADAALGKPVERFGLLEPARAAVRKRVREKRRTSVANLVGLAHRRDGSSFMADVTVRTHYGRQGDVERMEGVFRDATGKAGF